MTTAVIDGMERVKVGDVLHVHDVPPRFAIQHVSVVLRGVESSRWLPIWMTKEEAFAVRAAAAGTEAPFPTVEPPLWPVVEAAGGAVERVAVTEAQPFGYGAEIRLRVGEQESTIASPPASALMLALRADASIYVSEDVFADRGMLLTVVTGRVRISESGRATLDPESPFGPDESTARVSIDEAAVAAFGLVDGDRVKSRTVVPSEGPYRINARAVIAVNDETPVLLHDVPAVGTPLRLAVPSRWVSLAPGIYVPRDSVTPEVLLLGGSTGPTSLSASEVPGQILEELGSAVERLDDSDLTLGEGFEASLRMRALRDIQVPPDAESVTAGMMLPAGGTAQVMLAVRGGHPVMASLATVDWERWGALTPVLSRSTLVGGEADLGELTEREVEVLRHIADGETNLQIAERLGISEHTVANHVRSILLKLEAANRTQAASYAFARGILEGAFRS